MLLYLSHRMNIITQRAKFGPPARAWHLQYTEGSRHTCSKRQSKEKRCEKIFHNLKSAHVSVNSFWARFTAAVFFLFSRDPLTTNILYSSSPPRPDFLGVTQQLLTNWNIFFSSLRETAALKKKNYKHGMKWMAFVAKKDATYKLGGTRRKKGGEKQHIFFSCFPLLLIWACYSVVAEKKASETIVIQTAKFKIQFMNPYPVFPTLMSSVPYPPPAKQSH